MFDDYSEGNIERDELIIGKSPDDTYTSKYIGKIYYNKGQEFISFVCSGFDDGVYNTNLYDVASFYTEEEARYWYDIVYNEVIKHKNPQ